MNPSDGPIPPDENRVREACRKFDDEYGTTERALKDLLRQYSTNDDEAHVFLKVVAVNRLYFAGPLDVHGMAEQIHLHADTIDPALAQGAPSIVDEIARFIVDKTGCKFYSFASKYCSWHNPSSYPIWDENVCRYLASLKNTPFAKPDNWERYAEFVALMAAFREHYRLDLSGFEDIDKFLWMNGGESSSIAGGPPKGAIQHFSSMVAHSKKHDPFSWMRVPAGSTIRIIPRTKIDSYCWVTAFKCGVSSLATAIANSTS